MKFAPRVVVCTADGMAIYHTHRDDAARLVRDGLASRKNRVQVELAPAIPGKSGRGGFGNPQKYTFLEALGNPVDAHCHSLKMHVADPRNWPIYRAALVDCLPSSVQAEIRVLFAQKAA